MGLLKLAYETALKVARPLKLKGTVEEVGFHIGLWRSSLLAYGRVPDAPQIIFIEPLLHPQFQEMLRYSKKKGLRVDFNTNANSLTEEKAKAILESGLDKIVFSVDGVSAATYEKVRRGGNYDRVLRNIKRFTHLKNTGKYDKPETGLQTIIMNGTEEGLLI